jgi:hypothetical protein
MDSVLPEKQAANIIVLARAFNKAGGMHVDTPAAIRAHIALADACDAADDHTAACELVRSMVDAFDY